MTADLANETILFSISEPWPQNENLNDLTAMRGRPALEPATYLRGGTFLDDPTPYAYSAIRSAQPLGMRSQHEPPHLAATAPRPTAPRIKPRQLKSGRATAELMEPEFRYRPTESILTKIDVRKKYEFPGSYDPILGLGAPARTFDHPGLGLVPPPEYIVRCRSKLEELEIADPSRRAALALHGRDVEDYDQDLVPEADRETRELDRTNTRWAPSYGKTFRAVFLKRFLAPRDYSRRRAHIGRWRRLRPLPQPVLLLHVDAARRGGRRPRDGDGFGGRVPRRSRMGRIRPFVPMPRPAAARAAAMRADIVDRKSIWSSSGESGGGAGTGLWATGAAIRSSSDSSSSSTSNLSIRTAGDAGSQPTAPRASGPGDRRCSASESSSELPPDCTSSSGGAFIGVCAGVVAGVDASDESG